MTKNTFVLHNSHFLKAICFLAFFTMCSIGLGQTNNSEQIKRLQRTIFIHNFAQQIEWPNIANLETFKIGVLGPDRTAIDLKVIAKERKIFGLQSEVIRFQDIKNVSDVQVLYVNNLYNYDVNFILRKISGKEILLITEDYDYQASMINMVNVGDSFEYEINVNNIVQEGFTIAPSLRSHAISNAEKWKELYQSTSSSLTEAELKTKEQSKLIKAKESKIASQKNEISAKEKVIISTEEKVDLQNQRIRTLYSESELQQKQYKEKVEIEQELTESIQQQLKFIETQNEKIASSELKILEQEEFLKLQNDEIEEKAKTLKEKDDEISARTKVNWLLAALVALTLLGSFFLYRSYLTKKRLTKILSEKNESIEKQAAILESKNRELEQFAYITSHDLKEPLITISSLIGLLEEDYGSKFDDEGKANLNYIRGSADRMTQLIDDLLAYSRLGTKRTFKSVNCNTLLETLKVDLANVIERSATEIHLIDLPIVKGSEIELRLLFQNLITNAIKFTDTSTKPHIEILCTPIGNPDTDTNGKWEFSITDNGIGIPEMYQDRIFSIFQRLHTNEEYEGTGIGLAHCKKIVEAHGGDIWLDSVVGEGSTFYFTIPFVQQED